MLDLVRSLSGLSSIRPKIDLRQMEIDSISNPIGLAQYFSQLNKNAAPTYRFQSTAQPPFKCVAELGDGRQVEGVAHRRTDAKSDAARLLLKLLKNDQLKVKIATLSRDQTSENDSSDSSTVSTTHPVAQLQQFCHEHQVYLPKYHYQANSGEVGVSSHTCRCSLLHLVTIETRQSQREARRAAAAIMFQLVQKFPPSPTNATATTKQSNERNQTVVTWAIDTRAHGTTNLLSNSINTIIKIIEHIL